MFKRDGMPASNDTSFGVGYAPFSETENIVMKTEELLNSKDFKKKYPHARDVARYKLRWPVRELIIVSEDEKVLKAAESLREVIMEQANAKNIVSLSEFENMPEVPHGY